MKAGDCFVLKNRSIEGGHPRFVVSDTALDNARVVVLGITAWDENKDPSCILEAHEDTAIIKKSVVSYRDAVIVSNAFLDQKLASGEIVAGPPLSQKTLQKIRAGCAMTRRMPNEAFDFLDAQGLIPIV